MRKKSEEAKELQFQVESLEDRTMLSSVSIIAAGDMGDEAFELIVDGQTEAIFQLDGTQDQTFQYYHQETLSPDSIRIQFTNDKYEPENGIDRNLIVDKIVIDGVDYETEDPSTFSTGTWKPEDGVVSGNRESETLHSGGYFQYAGTPQANGSQLEIRVRGDEGTEQFKLIIKGQEVGTFNATTVDQTITYQHSEFISESDVRIEFINDQFDPSNGIDSNLIVDFISIDGTTYQTEDSSVFSTGTWLPTDGVQAGFGRGEVLNSNGYLQFGAGDDGGTSTGSVIEIRVQGDEGTERFNLLIGGEVVGTYNASTNLQTIRYEHDGTVSADDVRIEFINDEFNQAAGIDSNLTVDFITIDGEVFQTESPSVFSTGSWLPSDGIAEGFGRSETLNSNGYFQYSNGGFIGSEIEVVARGDEGVEQFNLIIAGEVVDTFTVGTTFQTFRYTNRAPVSAGDIRIEFINDSFDSSQGVDANLIVDFIQLDGTRIDAESPSVFSTGSFLPEDGIVPGFGRSDTLNVNGFFQFGGNGDFDLDGDGKLNSVDRDDDNDGISDDDESFFGTNPFAADSDGDGIQDGTELGFTTGTPDSVGGPNPFVADQDPSTRTNPLSADTDGDGLTDGQEDPNADGASPSSIGQTGTTGSGETDPTRFDTDGDGLSDGDEVNIFGTNPLDTDTDDGTVADGVEVGQGTNPANNPADDVLADFDGDGKPDDVDTDDDNDGILDALEVGQFGTNPLSADSDGDGVQDGTELGFIAGTPDSVGGDISFQPDADPSTTTDPLSADTDGDGLTDGQEDPNADGASPNTIGQTGTSGSGETDPTRFDTDGDGLSDGDEVNTFGTNPLDTDTDDGTVADGVEVGQGTNPVNNPADDVLADFDQDGISDNLDADDDNDGLSDEEEASLGTNPFDADTDGDGIQDGTELGRDTAGADSFGGPVSFRPDADPTSTTDPLNADTDGDGLTDGEEDVNGDGATVNTIGGTGTSGSGETDPNNPDTDGEGLTDGDEVNVIGTDPLDTDTDDGSVDDASELADPGALQPVLTVTLNSQSGANNGALLAEVTAEDGSVETIVLTNNYDANIGRTFTVDLEEGSTVRLAITIPGNTIFSDNVGSIRSQSVADNSVRIRYEDDGGSDFDDVIATATITDGAQILVGDEAVGDLDPLRRPTNPVDNPDDDVLATAPVLTEIQAPNSGGNVFNGFIWDKNDISFTTKKNPFDSDVLGLSTSEVAGRTFVLNDLPVAIGVSDNDSSFGDSIKGGRITGFSQSSVGGETLRVGDDFENEYSYLVREAGTARLITLYAVETEGDVIGFASDAPMQQGVVYTFVSRVSTDPRVDYSDLASSFLDFRNA